MAFHHWTLACGALLLASPTWAHRVVCPPGDNSVIQACLDGAGPGDELVFAGSYRIDPSKPYVVLRNATDVRLVGDGAAPPIFRCQVEADGRPLSADSINDGIQLLADGVRVENISMSGLAFEGCSTAIVVLATNDGSFSHVDINDTTVSNVYYGVLVQAPLEHLVVRGSRILNAEQGITLNAELDYLSSNVEVTGNTLQGLKPGLPTTRNQAGILAWGVLSGKIARNTISGFSQMVEIPGLGIAAIDFDGTQTDLDIVHNAVDDVGVGISLGGPSEALGRVTQNRIREASTAGIVLRAEAHGRHIGINDLEDNTVDVRATGVDAPVSGESGSSDNVVELLCGQTYQDFGMGNRFVVQRH